MRGRRLELSTPVVMGVLNVTPDSFSDGARLGHNHGGRFRVSLEKALSRARELVAEGAAIIDIGGESTRPGAVPVAPAEELGRVVPVIEALVAELDVALSVDTSSPEVMREACRAGAHMINDIRALRRDGALEAAAETDAAVCLMHTRAEPAVMQQDIRYEDVVQDICRFLKERLAETTRAGIKREKLVIDPGFGFGKTQQQNYRLLHELDTFLGLGVPVLVGISRKSMLGQVTGRPVDQRLAAGVAAAMVALDRGARIIRTHDVAATVDAIKVHCALAGAASGS